MWSDDDNSGQLDEDELADAFTRLGLGLQRPQIRQIISFCDADGDGKIDFREFMLLLGGGENDVADPEVVARLREEMKAEDAELMDDDEEAKAAAIKAAALAKAADKK